MKSLLLLGLTGLAANVQAHPQRREPNESPLSKRGIDLEKFRLPEISDYTTSSSAKADESVVSINKRGDYIEAAKELVKTVAPGAEYRLVNDHYVSSDGVAHVNFKQTLHGIDVDNGDFNVNVSSFLELCISVHSRLTALPGWQGRQDLLVRQQLLQGRGAQGEPA